MVYLSTDSDNHLITNDPTVSPTHYVLIVIPRLHDRANIELARRATVISMLIRRAGGL